MTGSIVFFHTLKCVLDVLAFLPGKCKSHLKCATFKVALHLNWLLFLVFIHYTTISLLFCSILFAYGLCSAYLESYELRGGCPGGISFG